MTWPCPGRTARPGHRRFPASGPASHATVMVRRCPPPRLPHRARRPVPPCLSGLLAGAGWPRVVAQCPCATERDRAGVRAGGRGARAPGENRPDRRRCYRTRRPDEVPLAVAFLSGELRQRQIGVGYAALRRPARHSRRCRGGRRRSHSPGREADRDPDRGGRGLRRHRPGERARRAGGAEAAARRAVAADDRGASARSWSSCSPESSARVRWRA